MYVLKVRISVKASMHTSDIFKPLLVGRSD